MAFRRLISILNLGSGFEIDGVNQKINVAPQVSFATAYVAHYFGRSQNGTTTSATRNATLTRTGVGRWTVAFAIAHPDGVNYHPSLTTEEQSSLRDTPDITVVQGTQTANGFDIMVTTEDSGSLKDQYVNAPFSFEVTAPITVGVPA